MSDTKKELLDNLVIVAFNIDKKAEIQESKTKDLQRMATLARDGKKDTVEFKQLEAIANSNTVVDFGDEVSRLRNIVKSLKEYGVKS